MRLDVIGSLVILCLVLLWEVRSFRGRSCEQSQVAVSPLRDALTTLPNRVLFADRVGQGIERAKRNKVKLVIALVEFEAEPKDGAALRASLGDRMMVEGANRLKATLRRSDTLARVGDSFVAAFEVPEVATVEVVLRRIQTALEAPVILDDAPGIHAAIKMATAVYPDDGPDADSLVRLAASRSAPRRPEPTVETDPIPSTPERRGVGRDDPLRAAKPRRAGDSWTRG